jgi:hypothetical protein
MPLIRLRGSVRLFVSRPTFVACNHANCGRLAVTHACIYMYLVPTDGIQSIFLILHGITRYDPYPLPQLTRCRSLLAAPAADPIAWSAADSTAASDHLRRSTRHSLAADLVARSAADLIAAPPGPVARPPSRAPSGVTTDPTSPWPGEMGPTLLPRPRRPRPLRTAV